MRRVPGYTLVEAAVVVAIVGLLATLAIGGYGRMQARTRFSTSTNQLLADLSNARGKARSEEQPLVVAFLASSRGTVAPRYVVIQDNARTFDLAAFKPGELPTGARQIADFAFSKDAVTIAPSLTVQRPALPAPFGSVRTVGGISFAKGGFEEPYDLRGTVTFQTDGRATFSDGFTTGSLELVDASAPGRALTVGIIGVNGAFKGF